MSAYTVEFLPAAARALAKIDPEAQRRIQGAVALLARNPRPPASVALRGRDGLSVRIGDYRMIYAVHDDLLLVVVITVGHRRDVYRH